MRSWLRSDPLRSPEGPRDVPRLRAVGVFGPPVWSELGPAPLGRGRARLRWRVRRAARRFALFALGESVHLALGRPRLAPAGLREPSGAADRAMVQRAFQQALHFVRACVNVRTAGSGRRSGALLSAVGSLADVRRELGHLSGELSGYLGRSHVRALGSVHCQRGTVPLPIVASRVALPETGGASVDIGRLLPPRLREPFCNPTLLRDDEGEEQSQFRGARVHASKSEWAAFLHRLDVAGELVLVLDDECEAAGGACPYCGYFAVAKSDDADRTICNRVPQNERERSLRAAGQVLAHGSSLVDFHLRSGEVGRVTAHDLSNYYHVCRVPFERAVTNQLGPPVRLSDFVEGAAYGRLVDRLGLDRVSRALQRGESVRACQGSLPMGDINAVDFGQVAHMRALRSVGCLSDTTLTTYRGHFPRGDVVEGVVVDDYVILQRLPRCAHEDRGNDCDRADVDLSKKALGAYAEHGLPEASHKRREQVLRTDVWGASFDGDRGWVSASCEFVLRALGVTAAILRLGCCSGSVLRCLLGCWAHILTYRRPAFAFLGHAYRAARSEPPGVVFRLSVPVREELSLLVSFAPLLGTDLRAGWGDRLWAIDASPWAGAVVSTSLASEVVEELWRHRVRKAGYVSVPDKLSAEWAVPRLLEERRATTSLVECARLTRLLDAMHEIDPEGFISELVRAHVPGPVRALANSLAAGCGWRQERRCRLSRSEHINVKESRVFHSLVKLVAGDVAGHGARHLYLGDSMVQLGAQAKGRSPSAKLNSPLRSAVCTTLLAGLYFGGLHVSSESNPADPPSRDRPVRAKPEFSPPPWLYDWDVPGSPGLPPDWQARFDEWLCEHGWQPDVYPDLARG